MRYFIMLFCGLIALPAPAQVYRLLYMDGKVLCDGKPIEPKTPYKAAQKVRFAGKVAIFYDTIRQELASIRRNEEGTLAELAIPIRVERFKCCVAGFSSFLAYHKKPYPILYPDMELSLVDVPPATIEPQLIYKFWDTKEKNFRMRPAPIVHNEKKYVLEVGKIVYYLQTVQANPLMEPFFFYTYQADGNHKLLKERALQIIEAGELKEQIAPLVTYLRARYPSPTKAQKEQMLALLCDFVYEVCGYPDEEYFKQWLKEFCALDLHWKGN